MVGQRDFMDWVNRPTKLIFDIIHLKPGTLTARRFGLSWSHDFRDFLATATEKLLRRGRLVL